MATRIITLILTLSFWAVAGPEDTPISSLEELRKLSPEAASEKLPVELKAQVTRLSPKQNGVFIHDGEFGCYIAFHTANTRELAPELSEPGQSILVKGHTLPGLHLPHIAASEIEILGNAQLPKPIPLTEEMLLSEIDEMDEMDCAWITAQGKVRARSLSEDIVILTALCLGEEIEIHLPNTLESREFSLSLVDTQIEVNGVLCSNIDDNRQLTARYIGVPSPHYIRTPQGKIPLTSIEDVLKTDTPGTSLRVRGVITYHDHSRIVIQKDGLGLLLRTTNPCEYDRGDLIEASGLVWPEAFTTTLKAKSFSLMRSSSLPDPALIEKFDHTDRKAFDNTLVTITAQIIGKDTALNGSILTCSANGKIFKVGLPVPWTEVKKIPTKATAEITGIFQHATASAPLNPTDPEGFQLLVMSTEDIKILSLLSWWNLQRVLNILAIVGAILAMALTWVWLLRRKVAEQTDTIRSQVAQESSAQERDRVARELHDSLEQNLSAVAFQIDNVIRHFERQQQEKLGPALEITKKMLKACQRESREAIYDLRGSDEEAAAWRDEMLLTEAERLGSEIKLKITGKSYSLDVDHKRQLRRIVREATYNSLRHGKATEVLVEYHYEPELFTAKVYDNGSGFDTKGPRPEGHFGLAGMEERAGRIGGKFVLESALGSGTTVSIQLPVHRNLSSKNDQSPSH